MIIPFWLVIVALMALTLGFVLWPLMHHKRDRVSAETDTARRQMQLDENIALYHEHLAELEESHRSGAISEEQFRQVKLELERSLLEDEHNLVVGTEQQAAGFGPRGMIVVALVVVFGAVGMYSWLGAKGDVQLQRLLEQKAQLDHEDMRQQREPDPARARELGARLEQRLKRSPNNLQYWFLLASNAMELGEFGRAVDAYREVLARDPRSSRVMGELAEAMYLRDNQRMSPGIAELARAAIELDANNTVALWLAGINAFEGEDYHAAADYWQRALRLVGPHSAAGRSLQVSIQNARQRAGDANGEVDGEIERELAAGAARIRFDVSLAEQVQAEPDQWVFVYARAWQGSPMPLAITRVRAGDLPMTIILDDTMAMSTAASLSQADRVELVARISAKGEAMPQPGDWQGTFGPVDVAQPAEQILLEIDHQVEPR